MLEEMLDAEREPQIPTLKGSLEIISIKIRICYLSVCSFETLEV